MFRGGGGGSGSPGPKGDSGSAGPAPSITAVANQIAAGAAPTAVVTGTSPNLTLTLGIPTLNSSILRTGIGTQIAFVVSTAAGSNTGSFVIPANTVSSTQAFFQVDAYFTATNDAMTKAVTLSIGGQNIATFSTTTGSRGNGLEQTGMNRGALNSQVWKPLAANGGLGTSAQVGITATTIDWTVDNTFLVTVAVSGTVVAGSTATCEYVNLIIFN